MLREGSSAHRMGHAGGAKLFQIRQFRAWQQHPDGSWLSGNPADQRSPLKGDDHLMHRRRGRLEEPLHVGLRRWATDDLAIVVDESEILSLRVRVSWRHRILTVTVPFRRRYGQEARGVKGRQRPPQRATAKCRLVDRCHTGGSERLCTVMTAPVASSIRVASRKWRCGTPLPSPRSHSG